MVCPFYSPNPCNIPFLAVNQIIQIIKNKLSKKTFLIFIFLKGGGGGDMCVCVGGGGGCDGCVYGGGGAN